MQRWIPGLLLLSLVVLAPAGAGPEARTVLLRGRAASLQVQLRGGVLSDFRLAGDGVNPLRGLGHFLGLDRWGPPSAAEEKNGMPFHGEASRVEWRVTRPPETKDGWIETEMEADLPLAGLHVRRTLRMSESAPFVRVREQVTNRNRLGRILNIVQHPTIGAPFLDEKTEVDAGAGRGFMQSSPLPDPERPEVRWPAALHQGRRVDLRRLTDDPNPNVVSFEVTGEVGWTTACAPDQRLLIGYVWPRRDYPWFNAWRHVENGKPSMRGLEFGTTGLHQPFGVLVAKGRIFDLPLYTHLDAGESFTREYGMFLARLPAGFQGVRKVEKQAGQLVIEEREGRRRLTLPEGLF